MKKQKIACTILCCIIAVVWGALVIALFIGCTIAEKERIEVVRCPRIDADTIRIADWEE